MVEPRPKEIPATFESLSRPLPGFAAPTLVEEVMRQDYDGNTGPTERLTHAWASVSDLSSSHLTPV